MIMTKEEIRKAMYIQKPRASFIAIKNGVAKYVASVMQPEVYEKKPENFADIIEANVPVVFHIPVDDMGSASFDTTMDAKLLSRWISEEHLI